jgi:hypothetical protein
MVLVGLAILEVVKVGRRLDWARTYVELVEIVVVVMVVDVCRRGRKVVRPDDIDREKCWLSEEKRREGDGMVWYYMCVPSGCEDVNTVPASIASENDARCAIDSASTTTIKHTLTAATDLTWVRANRVVSSAIILIAGLYSEVRKSDCCLWCVESYEVTRTECFAFTVPLWHLEVGGVER